VAALVFKIWGVMWLVDAVVSLINLATQYLSPDFAGDRNLWKYAVRMNTISWAFAVVISIVLVRSAEAIARALFPREESVSAVPDAPALQTAGFSLLAVYLGIWGLRDVGTGLYALLAPRGDDPRFQSPRNPEHFVGAIVQLGAAIWLFVGTPRLVRFVGRLQEPWTAPKGAPPPDSSP
jgi:hypothetical protein